jgi:hypothetical protein
VLTEADDTKLAKSRRSVRVEANSAVPQLLRVFSLLGLGPIPALADASVADAWGWASGAWEVAKVPKRLNQRINDP